MTIDLRAINERSILLCDRLIAECERRMTNLEELSEQKLQTLTGIVSKMQRSNATAIRERRALEKDAKAFIKTLTLEEKRDAVVVFFQGMTHEQRLELFAQLRGIVEA